MPRPTRLVFDTQSGQLVVTRRGTQLALDFPARPPQPVTPCAGLAEALGGNPRQFFAARDYMVLYDTEDEVRELTPDLTALARIDRFALMVTAPASTPGVDFVSRFFAPGHGVPEDPRDRLGPLHADPLLGRASGPQQAGRPPGLGARRGTALRVPW